MKAIASLIVLLYMTFGELQCPVTIYAASLPPNAGSLLSEQQLRRQLPDNDLKKPEGEVPVVSSDETGELVLVKGFRFTGYEGLVREPDLQKLLSGYSGKSLSIGELKGLVQKVNTYLRNKGWILSKAYLLDQDVSSGMIELRIIQGKITDNILFKREKEVRICETRLKGIGSNALKHDQPPGEPQLERALLLMNDLPGVKAGARLSSGSLPGTSDVEIGISEGPLFSGSIWGDNHGNLSIGTLRANAMISLNDPSRCGDQLILVLHDAAGLKLARAAYSCLLTSSGLKGTISYTGMRYKLVEGYFASGGFNGYCDGLDAGFSYPLLRSRSSNVTVIAIYGYKSMIDCKSVTELSNRHSNVGTVGVSSNRIDNLNQVFTDWNANLTVGNLHESQPTAAAHILTNGTSGMFTHINLGLSRQQRFTSASTINFAWTCQKSFENLDSSEHFSLGGPYGVHAYPIAEGSGDSGHLFNTEFRCSLPGMSALGNLDLMVFYDAGRITVEEHRTSEPLGTATERNTYWLQGAGLGLDYMMKNTLSIRASWAHAIGDNPGRSVAGNNANGKPDKSRFWIQCGVNF
jgi:hemolysin activation/secretion protein